MTNGLALFAHWSVRQKLNRVSSVQLRRSVRAFNANIVPKTKKHKLINYLNLTQTHENT